MTTYKILRIWMNIALLFSMDIDLMNKGKCLYWKLK